MLKPKPLTYTAEHCGAPTQALMPEEKVSIKIKGCFLSLFHLTITYQDIWENNPKKNLSKQTKPLIAL